VSGAIDVSAGMMWLPQLVASLGEKAQPRYCLEWGQLHLKIPVPQLQVSYVLLLRSYLMIPAEYHHHQLLGSLNTTQTADPSFFTLGWFRRQLGLCLVLIFWSTGTRSTLRSLSDTAVCVYIRSTQTQWVKWSNFVYRSGKYAYQLS